MAGSIAQAFEDAFQAPGIPGPHPDCPAAKNMRDVVRDNDSVITVFASDIEVCVTDPGVGFSLRPEELPEPQPKTTLCSILGDDARPSILDQDIFKFEGTEGEAVTIKLEVDPSGSHTGERATLILIDRLGGVLFFRQASSELPNEITATLPATGEYYIIVAEQLRIQRGERFRGSYCLTLESSGDAWQTLKAAQGVE
jgi:hypothetical protein